MKHLYSLLFVLSFFSLKAQNWQTVYSDRVQYFDSSRLGIKIVSATIDSAGDSVFKNYPSTFIDRKSGQAMRFFGNVQDSANVDSLSWIGRKTIIKNNGYNGFANAGNNMYWINTLAGLNDTFIYYEDNSALIKAICTDIFYVDTFGIKDSVKRFKFIPRKLGPSFYIDSLWWNNYEVLLSKHHGILKIAAIDYIGQCYYDKYNQGKSRVKIANYSPKNYFTNYNFNNANVGDAWEYYQWDVDGCWARQKKEWRGYYEVVEKTPKPGTDTMIYKLLVKTLYQITYKDPDLPEQKWAFDTVYYEHENRIQNNEPFMGLLPNQAIGFFTRTIFSLTDECNLSIGKTGYGFESWGGRDYYSKIGGYEWWEDGSIYGGNCPVKYLYKIEYKDFCDQVSGSPVIRDAVWPYSVSEIKVGENNIYPNPASSTVFIEGEGITQVKIFDINGRYITELTDITASGANADVSSLAMGIYIVQVTTGQGVSSHKVIVNR